MSANKFQKEKLEQSQALSRVYW